MELYNPTYNDHDGTSIGEGMLRQGLEKLGETTVQGGSKWAPIDGVITRSIITPINGLP